MKFKDYADRDMLMIALADTIASDLTNMLQRQERATLVVPGGTTPGPAFDVLCSVDLDWARVDVMLSDERWVPEDNPRSNTRLLRERLLVDKAAQARLIPLYKVAERPEDVLSDLEAAITPCLPISVLLLGMGADMHTASIFPGADNLETALAAYAPVLVPMRAPGAPEPRVTLSARVLDEALSKHIVITGTEKRRALETAQGLDPKDAPVAAILENATVHWAE